MTPTVHQQVAAYETVIDHVQRGFVDPFAQRKFRSCVYDGTEQAGKPNFCGVGCLFSPAQLDDIKRRKLNSGTTVKGLIRIIGRDNIVATTGLGPRSLDALQVAHDGLVREARRNKALTREGAAARLISYCKARIRRISA